MKNITKYLQRIKKRVVLLLKKKNIPVISATVLLLVILILIPLIASKKINLFSSASTINSVLPANGTLTGNAAVVADSHVSGGQYVQLGSIPTSTSSAASSCTSYIANTPGGLNPWGGCWPGPNNTGYENAPGYPGSLTDCSNLVIQSNSTVKYCNFPHGINDASFADGTSAHNVIFTGDRFASNAVN